jgi:L-asparaginase/beta-aspartyl-peptidase (threonine type)
MTPYLKYLEGCDTIGVVAKDMDGDFAASNSTGGTGFAFPGRIGDTPIVGAVFYAGPLGAIVTTGVGEEIVRNLSAKEGYDMLAAGEHPQNVCDKITAGYETTFGILIITKDNTAAADNRDMPVVVRSSVV